MRRHEGGTGPAPAGVVRSCTPGRTPGQPRQLLRAGPGPGTVERESGKSRWRAGQARSFFWRLLWRATPLVWGMEKETGQPQARPKLGPLKLGCLTIESVFSVRPREGGGPGVKVAGGKSGSPLARGRTLERTDNRISSECVSLADGLLRSFEPELANECAPLFLLGLDVGANALDGGRV